MQLPSLREFIDALSLNWRAAFAAGMATSAIVYGYMNDWPLLSDIPQWLILVAAVIALFGWANVVTNLLAWIGSLVQSVWTNRNQNANRRKVVKKLHKLPPDQHDVMAQLFSSGKQSFTARVVEEKLTPLVTLGLVIKLPGQHSVLDWPYIIPDDVWEEMGCNAEGFTID